MVWSKNKSDPHHLNRESVTKAAVTRVYDTIVPTSDRPHKGDVNSAVLTVLPILEKVFTMPPDKCPEGSEAWFKSMIAEARYDCVTHRRYTCFVNICANNIRFPFKACVKYERLMSARIAKCIADGNDDGFPIAKEDEIPSDTKQYSLNPKRVSNPNATCAHSNLPFLRAHSVQVGVDGLKNRGLYPVELRPGDTPDKAQPWNNFAQVMYTFHVLYCDAEGLTTTNNLAREVLLYVFYGSWFPPGQKIERPWPVIRCLHKKVIAGRHRFGKYVKNHFGEFIDTLTNHKDWKSFMLDKGEGTAPMKYLILIEKGLRSFGMDIHAMGSGAMRTRAKWAAVPVWRKREAYIALVRVVLERDSYRQWDCFALQDYVERINATKTFVKRHLPLSDGNPKRFGGKLPDPPMWKQAKTPSPKAKRKRVRKIKPAASASASASAPTATSTTKPTQFDVEKNCFVPFE